MESDQGGRSKKEQYYEHLLNLAEMFSQIPCHNNKETWRFVDHGNTIRMVQDQMAGEHLGRKDPQKAADIKTQVPRKTKLKDTGEDTGKGEATWITRMRAPRTQRSLPGLLNALPQALGSERCLWNDHVGGFNVRLDADVNKVE